MRLFPHVAPQKQEAVKWPPPAICRSLPNCLVTCPARPLARSQFPNFLSAWPVETIRGHSILPPLLSTPSSRPTFFSQLLIDQHSQFIFEYVDDETLYCVHDIHVSTRCRDASAAAHNDDGRCVTLYKMISQVLTAQKSTLWRKRCSSSSRCETSKSHRVAAAND